MSNTPKKNSDNGLITKLWGAPLWEALHSISFGYPLKPTESDKIKYKSFFMTLGNVLPCVFCRDSYTKFIADGKNELTDAVFENRANLTRWLYNLHEQVNEKLDVTYGMTYEELVERYESYRATDCKMTNEMKKNAFQMNLKKKAPIIKVEEASKFIEYAKMRNYDMKKILKVVSKLDRKGKLWEKRNVYCWKIINKMRLEGIEVNETEGKYKGYPTMEQLKLLSFLSTFI